jgi:hypothetical protein
MSDKTNAARHSRVVPGKLSVAGIPNAFASPAQGIDAQNKGTEAQNKSAEAEDTGAEAEGAGAEADRSAEAAPPAPPLVPVVFYVIIGEVLHRWALLHKANNQDSTNN